MELGKWMCFGRISCAVSAREAVSNGYYNIADNQMRPSDIQSYHYAQAPGQYPP